MSWRLPALGSKVQLHRAGGEGGWLGAVRVRSPGGTPRLSATAFREWLRPQAAGSAVDFGGRCTVRVSGRGTSRLQHRERHRKEEGRATGTGAARPVRGGWGDAARFDGAKREALAALTRLGYPPAQAESAVRDALAADGSSTRTADQAGAAAAGGEEMKVRVRIRSEE